MFSLTVQISATDLPVILEAAERIVLIKNIGSGKPVAWIATQPLQQSLITWEGGYSLFASNSPTKVGGRIAMSSDTSANGGFSYPYSILGFGAGASHSGLTPQQYRVVNDIPSTTSPGLQFGLAQTITVDGKPSPQVLPLNAEMVPAMQSTIQNATDTVTIWLQSGVVAGQILTVPSAVSTSSISGTLVVPFTTGAPAQTVLYSSNSGRFELVP